MGQIGSVSSSNAGTSVSSVYRSPTAGEVDPLDAGMGTDSGGQTAAALAIGASASVSFSSEGLKRLEAMAGDAIDSVEGAIVDAGRGVVNLAHDAATEVRKVYGAVADAVGETVDKVEDAVGSVEHTVADAAGAVKDGIGSVVDKAGRYIAMGVAALG